MKMETLVLTSVPQKAPVSHTQKRWSDPERALVPAEELDVQNKTQQNNDAKDGIISTESAPGYWYNHKRVYFWFL